ncbi:MAG: hypothetical protein AAFQ02_04280 [Bacteroidota bacterium]
MKYIINLLILALIVFLGFALYNGIKEPIAFRTELEKRENTVISKLEQVRKAQEIHREIKGEYAKTFEDLVAVLKTDSIPFIQILADPEDPDNPDKFKTNTLYSSAIDSINNMGIDLDELKFVPYTDKAVAFDMQADTMTYQSTLVPVMEAMTRYESFMGPFANERFRKYEKDYDPASKIGFGSMSSPNLEGNWN